MSGIEFPAEFLDRLKAMLGSRDFEEVLSRLEAPSRTIFRVNRLKGDRQSAIESLRRNNLIARKVGPESYSFFEVDDCDRRALTESELFYQGFVYIQNPSSQLAVHAMAPRPGEAILDLAAAPGGKTLLAADLMRDEGRIKAIDSVRGRFFKLKSNIESSGTSIIDSFLMDGRSAGKRWPEAFDRVLLDAPCSSEARFQRSDPSSWRHWSARKIKETSKKQKRLIISGFDALKPGGIMLYCTCAFAPEENEAVVNSLLKRVGTRAEILDIDLEARSNFRPGIVEWREKAFHPDLVKARRILPDGLFDGFFLCLLKKASA